MAAVLVQVADAVVERLNTVDTFSQSFTAKRSYPTWKVPLTKICGLRVDVVPTSHSRSELQTQGSIEYECRLVIVIRQKFAQSDRQEETDEGRPVSNEAIDALVLLVEEICEFLYSQAERRLSIDGDASRDAALDTIEIQNTYIDEHLQSNAQFTGIIRATYVSSIDV